MTKAEYVAYLRSDHWQEKRKEAFAHYGSACGRCKAYGYPLHVHHKTYKRLHAERLSDLEILCAVCHRREHGLERWKEVIGSREFTVIQLPPATRKDMRPAPKKRKHEKKAKPHKPRKLRQRLIEENEALHQRQRRRGRAA